MEQSDSTSRVTPYDLATLASRIYPDLCGKHPGKAIALAQTLLIHAANAIVRREQEDRLHEEESEAYNKELETRVDWARGIKNITRESRRERAIKRFCKFMKQQEPENDLARYMRDGFTLEDVIIFEHEFANWKKQPKRRKRKQGRAEDRSTTVGYAPNWWGLSRQNHGSALDKFPPTKTAKGRFSSAKIGIQGDNLRTCKAENRS